IYELVDEFAGEPGPTLNATTFSKWGPDLSAKAGGGTLVLAGVSTDCCVLSTALAAADAGTPVRVVGDACAGANDDSHAAARRLPRLRRPLVEVATVAAAPADPPPPPSPSPAPAAPPAARPGRAAPPSARPGRAAPPSASPGPATPSNTPTPQAPRPPATPA